MKNIKRIVAMIAMLAVLLSSFAFAEDVVAAETAEPIVAASVPAEEPAAEEPAAVEPAEEEVVAELLAEEEPAEEPAAEPAVEESAEETAEEPVVEEPAAEEPAEEDAELTIEEETFDAAADEAAPAAVCYHVVYCVAPNVCVKCNQAVSGIELTHPEGVISGKPSVLKNDPSKHGYLCPCGQYLEVEEHYVSCTSSNSRLCDDCGAIVDLKPTHFGQQPYQLLPGDESKHAHYCTDCKQYYDIEEHYAVCDSDDLDHCDLCGVKITAAQVYHEYWKGVCSFCGKALTIEGISHNDMIEVGIGESFPLDVVAEPADGLDRVEYTSKNPKIASVDENGMVKGLKAGKATIQITAYGKDGAVAESDAKVTVKKAPTKVTVSPKSGSLVEGETAQLKANIGGTSFASQLTWTSSDPTVAYVNEDGFVTAISAGKAEIKVSTFNGKTASCKLTVYAVPTQIEVETEVDMYVKQSLSLNAKLVDDEGAEGIGKLKYTSSDKNVVTVSSAGKLTAKKVSSEPVEITIESDGGLTETVYVTVYKAATKVMLEETKVELTRGDTYQIEPLIPEDTHTVCTFTSAKKTVASVDKYGLVTAEGDGTTTITVKIASGKTAKLSVKVVDPYKPDSVTLDEEGTVYLSIEDTLQLGAELYPATAQSELIWESNKAKYATVDENGLVTPVAVGTATIRVSTYNGKYDTVKVFVFDPEVPYAVELDAEGTKTINIGETLQLNAEILPGTAEAELKWTSSKTAYAKVDQTGLVTPVKAGTATIKVATKAGLTDTVKVKVTDKYKPTSIELPNITTIGIGDTMQLTPSIEPANAMTILKWESSNKNVLTVDADGNITAVGTGSASIRVTTHNGKKDTLKLIVDDPYTPTGIRIDAEDGVKIGVGEKCKLYTTMNPTTAVSKLTWTSSNKAIATVDAEGVVTGVAGGSVTIKVVTANGLSDTLRLTVDAGQEAFAGGIELGNTVGNSVSTLNLVEKKVWNESTKSYVVYYTDKGGHETVIINRESGVSSAKDKIFSIEILRYSDYRFYGVAVGMTASQAAKALEANGADVWVNDGEVIFAGSSSFGNIEVYMDSNGRVASISAYAG